MVAISDSLQLHKLSSLHSETFSMVLCHFVDLFFILVVMFLLASDRLLNSLSLRKLLAGNNHLQRVPDLLDHIPLEALDLQHNRLVELPEGLFYKALK